MTPRCLNRSVTPWRVGLDLPDGNTIDEYVGTASAVGIEPGVVGADQRVQGGSRIGLERASVASGLEALSAGGGCRFGASLARSSQQCIRCGSSPARAGALPPAVHGVWSGACGRASGTGGPGGVAQDALVLAGSGEPDCPPAAWIAASDASRA